MRKIGRICFLLFVLIVTKSSSAQQSIATAGTAVTQNFDGMGTSATATLPTGFRVNTTANWNTGTAATTVAAGTTGTGVLTGSSAGGTYNYANGVTASSTDRALGFLNTGGFSSPRNIIYAFTNNTGVTVTSINISFDYEKYRSGSRAFDWTFFHGATATAVNTAATDGNQSYAADANNTTIFNPPTSIAKTVTITGLSIANGATYYLAWTFTGVGGSTNGQGIGIDNFSITLNPILTPTLNPSPTSLTGFTYLLGAGPSAVQTFNLGGQYLTGFPGDMTVNAPANFEVSNAPGGPFGGTALIPYTSATLSAPVYVRLAGGLSVGGYSGNITFSGGGVTTPPTVALSGTVTSVAESNIIAVPGSETATISSLTTGPVTNGTSGVQVWSITIQDGGNDLTDSDLLPTIVNSIILQQNLGNAVNDWADAIEEIALFDGTTKLASGVVTTTTITFSGTPLMSVPDNGSRTLTIRLTLQTNHNNSGSNLDGDDFVFQIGNANVTADVAGSQFTTFSTISSANSSNVISVIATELRFTAPPFTTDVNAVMSPAPVVAATDIYGNIDRGVSGSVTISSTGTLSGVSTTSVAFASGSASFGNIIHTVVGSGYTLTATSSPLTAATSTTFDITNPGGTSFAKGDLLILAFNYNRDNGLNGIEDDEITFFSLKDITNGTIFYLTDNGYERNYAGLWGSTEGILRFQKTSGPTIPSGKILTIGINTNAGSPGNNVSHFKIIDQCGTDITSFFTLTLQGNAFNMNVQDDLWFGQGGSFTNVFTTGPDVHKVIYNGTILTGWTGTGYQSCIGNGTDFDACATGVSGTQGTRLVPRTSCFVIDLSTSSIPPPPSNDRGRVKYTGLLTSTDKKGWIDRLNDVTNWTGYADDASYDAGPNYVNAGTCNPLPIDPIPVTPGVWQGNKSTDWFDCDNWTSREVPDITTDVVINSGTYDALVDDASPFATLYSNLAVARNVNISNGKQLSLGSSAGDILNISNNMDLTNANTTFNNGSGILNVGGNITFNTGTIFNGNTGTINVAGNYGIAATAVMNPGSGTVVFNGNSAQTVTNDNNGTIFNNLTINNSSVSGITLAGTSGITMTGILTLTDGLVNTNLTNILTLTATATNPGGGSLASFVNGPMRKTGTTNFTFPVGKPVQPTTTILPPNNPINTGGYRPIGISNISPSSAVTETFQAEYQLANPYLQGTISANALGAGLQGISRCEYWDLTRTGTATATVTLSWSENTLGQSQCNVGPYITDVTAAVVVPYYGVQWGDQNSTFFGQSGSTAVDATNLIGTISWDGSTGIIDSYQKFVIGTINWQLAPLPFDLTVFNATGKNKQVQLDWTVNNNQQIKEYTLERSRDGQRFEFFKTVSARAQEQRASYTDLDPAPFAGWNYYRLRAVTHSGEVFYSDTRKVNMGQQAEIGLSPNPARNILTIRLPHAGAVTELTISNTVGQVLRQLKPTADVLTVNLSAWPSGVYYVRMISATDVIVKPFVKE